jgi:hypothetical protein
MSLYLQQAMFASRPGPGYRITNLPGGPIDLELVQFEEAPPTPRQERWSLTFRGPAGLSQGTYCLEHPGIGAFELFLVPVGRDALGNYYEAAFNRLLPA